MTDVNDELVSEEMAEAVTLLESRYEMNCLFLPNPDEHEVVLIDVKSTLQYIFSWRDSFRFHVVPLTSIGSGVTYKGNMAKIAFTHLCTMQTEPWITDWLNDLLETIEDGASQEVEDDFVLVNEVDGEHEFLTKYPFGAIIELTNALENGERLIVRVDMGDGAGGYFSLITGGRIFFDQASKVTGRQLEMRWHEKLDFESLE